MEILTINTCELNKNMYVSNRCTLFTVLKDGRYVEKYRQCF